MKTGNISEEKLERIMRNKNSKLLSHGFTLIELIVVIAIIAVLTALSVPYYNDYIYDSRVSVLKQNMANIRKVINQFRGDQGRGPFLVEVQDSGTIIHESQLTGLNASSELSSGAIQIVSQTSPYTLRRSNLKYLPALPILEDPADGSRITTLNSTISSAYFVDSDADGIYDLDSEFAYLEGNNNNQFDAQFDSVLYNFTGNADSVYEASAGTALDYIDFTIKSSEGTVY